VVPGEAADHLLIESWPQDEQRVKRALVDRSESMFLTGLMIVAQRQTEMATHLPKK
jgi:hypothetical protein